MSLIDSLKGIFKSKPKRTFADRTILVVDDNLIDLKILEKVLKALGCTVLSAVDGEIGLHVAISEKPDLILSDCNMPNMDGVEMVKRLRANEITQGIPVIFLTAEDSPRRVIECYDVEADSYMCKPINSKILMTQIAAILDEHLTQKQLPQ